MSADAATIMEYPISLVEEPRIDNETLFINQCKAGQAAALRRLYEEHRLEIYRVIARMIENEADREELLQEAFLQIYRSIGRFKGQSKLKTWVHRIAMNVILQQLRKKKYRIVLQFTDASLEDRVQASAAQLTPEEGAISGEKRKAVQKALAELPPKKRAVLVLHDFEGIPAKEIAKIVRTSVMTVRTRLFYARNAFYAYLDKDPSFSDAIDEEA